MLSRRAFLLAGLPSLACRKRKIQGFSGYAFVANAGGSALAVVDLAVLATVRHIELPENPVDVLWNSGQPWVYTLTQPSGTLYRVHVISHRVTGTVDSLKASQVLLRPAQPRLAYALRRDPPAIAGVDLDQLAVVWSVRLPEPAVEFDVAPEGDIAVACFTQGGRIGLVDLQERRFRTTVQVGASVGPARFRSDGRLLLVANPTERLIVAVDPALAQPIVELPLPLEPRHFCFKPDGGELFVTGPGLDAVVSVHPYLTQVGSTAFVGRRPGAMAACQKPDLLFVANEGSGDVSVLEIRTQKPVALVAAGQEPCAILLTPDKEFVLVLNRGSGDMAVIRMEKLMGRRGRFAPLFTMIPVGSKPAAAVIVPVQA